MTASEFAFLALGLMLGVATGAALVEVLRSRPPAPREVRLTVTPGSLSRRPSTLASALLPATLGPARGGPGDRRDTDREESPGASSIPAVRTPVRTLVGIAIRPEPDRVLAALRATPVSASVPAAGVPKTALQDDGSLRRSSVGDDAPGGTLPGEAPAATPPAERAASDAPTGGPGSASAGSGAEAGPCADERRIADERCAVAGRLASLAETAAATLREAQRAYDDHETRAQRAAEAGDPRALRAMKEVAQHEFRTASAAAHTREATEAAARAWLQEINRINQSARDAMTTLRHERDAVNELVTVLERLAVEADAARISSEAARESCLAAREAVAACEEAIAMAAAGVHVTAPLTSPGVPPARAPEPAAPDGPLAAAALVGEGEPVMFRLLRGDHATLRNVVGRLAGDDAAEQGRWQLQLTDLVDAIQARAIEASMLDFPSDHPFWSTFTRDQSRDIMSALASLGYRFDGLGGFSDERIPSQRDLSLAVGFAGLDPMRIRHWPPEAEMADLLRDVSVQADEYLAATAGSLTLGEMVAMLGRRADALADLWNAWGRVRPLLLQGTE